MKLFLLYQAFSSFPVTIFGGDGYNGPGLEAIAQENHRLSDGVFDQILNQQDTIMSYLMGQYEGELENA